MNECTLESFINFCDNMQIAEEGSIMQVSKVFKNLKNNVSILQNKIKNADGDPKKQIEYFREYKKLLSEAEDAINKIPKGIVEKSVIDNPFGAYLAAIVPVCASMAITMAWENKQGSSSKKITSLKDLTGFAPLLAGGAASIGMAHSFTHNTRKQCLDYIKESRKVTNQIIAYLESYKNIKSDSSKDENEYYSDLSQKADMYNTNLAQKAKLVHENMKKTLITKISNQLKSAVIKNTQSKNYQIEFNIDYYCFETDIIKGSVKEVKRIISTELKAIKNQYKDDLTKSGLAIDNIDTVDYDESGYIMIRFYDKK